MDETLWLAPYAPPAQMLSYLGSKASARKLRLFACAACRRIWFLLRDQRSRQAVEVSEHFADGLASQEELGRAAAVALEAARALTEGQLGWNAAQTAAAAAQTTEQAVTRALAAVADSRLAREIFGNPFRPVVIDPSWLAWNHGALVKMAQAIYDERAFHRLPVLADALEDAGCTTYYLLEHCRQRGFHARGCWVVDLLLGKA
jgi:hypothetical protein